MKIDSDFASNWQAAGSATVDSPMAGDFAAVLKQASQSDDGQKKTAAIVKSDAQIRQEKEAEMRLAHSAVVKELQDYLNKSPAEHLRDKVLKELGLSEEDLKAMPPEKRQAMEAKIGDRIREYLLDRKVAQPEEAEAALANDRLNRLRQGGTAAVANASDAIMGQNWSFILRSSGAIPTP